MNVDGLSLAPLVNELNAALAGGRVDKVFQPDPYSLLLWVRQPGKIFGFIFQPILSGLKS